MFVTNWISPTKIQKISEITNFFRHYFLSRTEVYVVFFSAIILFCKIIILCCSLSALLNIFSINSQFSQQFAVSTTQV